MSGVYPPDSTIPSRGLDVRVPWLASPVGPEAILRRGLSVAAQRLLASHIVVDCGLLPAQKTRILRYAQGARSRRRRSEASAP